MALQNGRLLHRIAAISKIVASDERVTLQGHGIRAGNNIILYW
jgi:hypothetical protein